MDENASHKKVVLIAEDDDDHFLLMKDAFEEGGIGAELHWVRDGEELMDYLLRRGAYHSTAAPYPRLILLDLNMPRKDGRQVLQEIKSHPGLRLIPLVVLTTSRNEEDIQMTYNLGGSFICKPLRLERIAAVVQSLAKYWLDTVEPPRLIST